ncbi:hypothetical protein BJ912DRAFT_1047920 [Pholiota molesta]|nr:hypothetical protein BJ912DRAFT_1047920 [Pholiota molesta]
MSSRPNRLIYYRQGGHHFRTPLRPKTNSSSISITSFPAELILEIFWLVITRPGNRYRGSPIDGFSTPLSNPTALLRLSHVCRSWREISLYHGQLWASVIEVDRNSLRWAKKLIQRAKKVPLVIHSDSEDVDLKKIFTSDTWRHVFARQNDWRILDIKLSVRADNQPLVTALVQPAPKLEYFQLHNTCHLSEGGEYGPRLVLPHDLFAGQRPPQLRRFSISNVFLPPSFDFSLWTNLTSLTMRSCQPHDDANYCIFSAQKWLEILAGMKRLQYLQIWWNDNDDIYMTENIKATSIMQVADVHLDHLRALDLNARYYGGSILADIFSKLSIPETCTTYINIKVTNNQEISDVTFERLMIGIKRVVRTWCAHKRTLRLDLNNYHHSQEGFTISAVDVPNDDDPDEDYTSLEFKFRHNDDWISWTGPDAPPTPLSRTLNVLKSLSVSSFEVLGLGLQSPGLQDADKNLLHNFLLGFTNITSACICDVHLGILDILVSRVEFDQSSQSYPKGRASSVLLPRLTSLVCLAAPEDFKFIEAYMAWRNLHGKLPESFEVKMIPINFRAS